MIDVIRIFLVVSLSANFLLFSIVLWQDKYARNLRMALRQSHPRCKDCGRPMIAEHFCGYCEKE